MPLWFYFSFFFPALAWSQTAVADEQIVPAEQTQQSNTGTSASPSDAAREPEPQTAVLALAPLPTAPTPVAGQKTDNSAGQQTKRMFWVVPNFAAVSAFTKLPPLSRREKFALAREDSVDYTSFILGGNPRLSQSMALDSYPELHHGIKGYGRYYRRAFADQASGAFFTVAIVPPLTHEDPRYYTRGYGGFFRRAGYALSQVVLTRTDSGRPTFNFSEVGGNALEAGLSNLYYPPQERGMRKTAENWGAQLESAALNNIIKEFWPDIRRRLFRQK